MSSRNVGRNYATQQLWVNPGAPAANSPAASSPITINHIHQARARLDRFAPLLLTLFPELASRQGLIESDLAPLPALRGMEGAGPSHGRCWVKADHSLPIAGSVKARGGIHEVLEFAEGLAIRHGILSEGGDYTVLSGTAARALFSQYEICVGSTGNLGLSIGLISSALGFRATVHMSAEAKQWKKDRLRRNGVQVVEHQGDYARAVDAGRAKAGADPHCYFVDDEQSVSLFAGYGVAAFRLEAQLRELGVAVDAAHPLFVYIPCGVGGAPAGITYGLKHLYGAAAHCFFVEPVASPCFLVRMQNPDAPGITVYDVGQDNKTEADGLAVPAASELAIREMRPLLSGIITTSDDSMFADLHWLREQAGMRVEPSAAAALSGPRMLLQSAAGQGYLRSRGLLDRMADSNHIVWTTGGLFVPDDEFARFMERGRRAREAS